MSLEACIAGLKDEGKIDATRARRFLKMHSELKADYARQFGEGTAAAMATRDLVGRLERDAIETRRTKLLQLDRQSKIAKGLADHVKGGGKAHQYALALMDHHEAVKGLSSVDNRRAAVRAQAWSQMGDFLHRFERDLLGRARNPAQMTNVVRELFGQDSGDAAARELAQAWSRTAEYLRMQFNEAGGHIGKMERWGLPQAHDNFAIEKAGFAAWRDAIVPLLDRERMIDDATGAAFTDAEFDRVLQGVYENIVSEGLNQATPGQNVGSKLANRRADSRFLHFRDADSWLQYQSIYGSGDAWNAIVGHVDGMARDIAAMQILGPNPALTIRWLGDALRQAEMPGVDVKSSGWGKLMSKSAAMEIDLMWRNYTGELNRPFSPTMARFFSGVRQWNVGSQLGGAAISAITSDPTWAHITARVNGLSSTRLLGEYAKLLNPADASHRRLAERAGLVMNEYTSRAEKMIRSYGAVPFNVHELSSRLADGVMRVSGLTPHSNAMKQATGLEVMMSFADNARTGFGKLDSDFRAMLERYGVDGDGWDKIRSTPLFEQEKQKFLRPDELAMRDDIDGHGLALKLFEMIDSETRFAVPGQSLRAETWLKAPMGVVLRPGTGVGDLLRSSGQYKGFSLIALTTHWQRVAWGGIGGGGRAYYLLGGAALLTLGGMATIMFRSIMSGNDPPPMDETLVARGFVQGGGAGILGDFVASGMTGTSRTGGGVLGYALGPTIGNVVDPAQRMIFGGVGDLASGEKSTFGREAEQLFEKNLPGSTLWYSRLATKRLFLDRLREMADPDARGAWRRSERRMMRDYGQGSWFPAGETMPERVPDFDNLLANQAD